MVKKYPLISLAVPLAVLLLASIAASPFNDIQGLYWVYFPVNLACVMTLWWGPRILPAVFINALFSLYIFNTPNPLLYPFYAIPETLEAALCYFLIKDRFKDIKIHRASPKHIGIYFVYGSLIPALVGSALQQGLFILTEVTELSKFSYNLLMGTLGDLIGVVSLSLPLIIFVTPKLGKLGLTDFEFEPIHRTANNKLTPKLAAGATFLLFGMLLITLYTDLSETWFIIGAALLVSSASFGIYATVLLNTWMVFLFVVLPRITQVQWEMGSYSQLINYTTILSLCFCSLITGSAISSLRLKVIELKKTESDFRQAKDLAEKASMAKSEFLARMSHEIRTPLNAVLGMLEILRDTELSEDQRKYLSLFNHAGENLQAIINDLLDFSKIEAKALTIENIHYDLHSTIRSVFDILAIKAEEKGLEFELSISDKLPIHQMGDPTRLRQILFNIIGNSIKFTPSGYIKITAGLCENNPQNFFIEFEDTGIGIAREKQIRLFTPFFQGDASITRSYGGTGLGLVISKNLAEIMGGSISMTSLLGRGTTFRVELPYRPSLETLKPLEQTTDYDWKKHLGPVFKILIVDDSEDNRVLIKHYLKGLPFICDEAVNGQDAVDKFSAHSYDFVFMDIQMPIINGYKATEIIRYYEDKEKLLRVPIVALTATAILEDLKKTITSGCNTYAVKPVKKKQILEILARYLVAEKPPSEKNVSHNTQSKPDQLSW